MQIARFSLFVLTTCLTVGLVAQVVKTSVKGASIAPAKSVAKQPKEIKWLSFQQAQELQKTNPKKIFVDVYTDWCGWCKRMDASTFQSPEIVDYVNQYYYAVKFNAEQKEPIEWNGKTYKNSGGGNRSTHELAIFLLNNRLGYPTTVFLGEDLNLIQPLPGFMEAEKLEPILHYFGTDNHKKMPWDAFEREYKKGKTK
jgi:thioredoxin-related protein